MKMRGGTTQMDGERRDGPMADKSLRLQELSRTRGDVQDPMVERSLETGRVMGEVMTVASGGKRGESDAPQRVGNREWRMEIRV